MKKLFLAAVLSLSLTAITLSQATAVTLRWFGQACFLITSMEGKKLLIDPFGSKLAYPPPAVEADAVLVTHEHFDHNNVGVVKGKPVILHGLKNNGADYNDIDQTVAGFHVKSFRSYHDSKNGATKGKNTIFLIEVDGLRLAHLGDIGYVLDGSAAKSLGKVDVLMIPVGGNFTIGPEDAWKVIGLLNPKIAIPMHYQTPKVSNIPIQPVEDFIAGHTVKRLGSDTVSLIMPKTQEIWVFPVP